MNKRWLIKTPNPQLQVTLSNALHIHPILAQLLINRGIKDVAQADDFLNADISRLHDPHLLKDMTRAVQRIQKARAHHENVLIFGDYDVDGITSSALLKGLLKDIGIEATNYIPHRMQEGYGLNPSMGEYAKGKDVSLLISVDCGINAFEAVEALNKNGIDTIIVDHHEPTKGKLPEAWAIINPKRSDCSYPFKSLATVGLVAKLAQALLGRIPEEILDLVAIGTIADVAELRGENRIFAKEGLPRINQTKNKGLSALLDIAKIKDKKFRPYFVGFILGPRINATGRMGSAYESLRLLLSEDKLEAEELARSLEAYNDLRQKTQNDIVQEAFSIVEQKINFKDHKVIVLNKEGWHKGVLGIVASRIAERYYRPTIVISTEEGIGVGSARSIGGFHIFEALHHCSDVLENFGGHERAAGLTLRQENIDVFRNSINEFANRTIQLDDLIPTLNIDSEIPLSSLSEDLVKFIETLEPFGEGNPEPVFCSRRLTVKSSPVVLGKDTLKFWVTDGRSTVPAVGFGMGKMKELFDINSTIDLVYHLSMDEWNGTSSISLKIKDIK